MFNFHHHKFWSTDGVLFFQCTLSPSKVYLWIPLQVTQSVHVSNLLFLHFHGILWLQIGTNQDGFHSCCNRKRREKLCYKKCLNFLGNANPEMLQDVVPGLSRQNHHRQGAVGEGVENFSQPEVQFFRHAIHFLILRILQIGNFIMCSK